VRTLAAAPCEPDLRLEKKLLRSGYLRCAGVDEVGRGCLGGPVTVGVVMVDRTVRRVPKGLRDSKLLTHDAREALVPRIARWAPIHAVGHASAAEIDGVGILGALCLAGWRAVAGLAVQPDVLVLDGNYDWLSGRPPAPGAVPVLTRVKADMSCASVAAASVLAKTERDRLMEELALQYPGYGWEANRGYSTPGHRRALSVLGPCSQHRRSWRPFLVAP